MPKKKTHEDLVNEVKVSNPNIKIIGRYINARTQIECQCKKCNYKWYPTPDRLHRGAGCPKCAGNIKKTHDDYSNQLKEINPNIQLLSKYTTCHGKIKYHCNVCGYNGEAEAINLLSGHGCPKCAIEDSKQKQRKTHETFVNEMKTINSSIEILGRYVNNNTRVDCRCKICNFEWNPLANNLLSGYGCPNCNMSSLEQSVYSYLHNENINFIQRHTFDDLYGVGNKSLSYDFYLPDNDILIECQGVQHEKPIEHFGGKEKFTIQQEHDRRKRQYAKDHNIKLLEIWYWDFDNIENILLRELGLAA